MERKHNTKKRQREKEKNDKMQVEEDSSDSEYESISSEEEVIENKVEENSQDYEEEKEEVEEIKPNKISVTLFDETNKKLDDKNEQLDFDNNAYDMLHRSKVEWPCMTIDFVIPENFDRNNIAQFYQPNKIRSLTADKYPYTTYMVAGSQTNEPNGFLYYMKWYNMYKTKYDDDPEKGADSDDEEAQNPYMKYQKVKVKGNINRIKSMKNSYLSAFWSDSPSIEIVNIKDLIADLEEQTAISTENSEIGINTKKRKITPKNITVKSFNKSQEGFALDWNNIKPGVLAVGGQDKKLEIYIPTDANCSDFTLCSSPDTTNPLLGHTNSIEDIQWSPHQENVLASCSVDKSIRFWDIRSSSKDNAIIMNNAHQSDVNVLSWNPLKDFLIASGGDDNSFKVWDIRYVKVDSEPITNMKWHRAPITSLMWDPFEESQLAVTSEDDRLSVWDFSIEPDDKQLFDNYNNEIPQQIVFLHQGQTNPKEVKFHPYFKNMICSTAENGINIFKPSFDEDSSDEEDEDEDVEMD